MVRYATVDDAEAIYELERQVFPDACVNEVSCSIELMVGRCWIADGQGYVLTRWGPEVIDVLRLGVLPEHQKKGLGRYMLRLVLLHADLPVMLTVKRSNAPALRLYQREGFTPVGLLPDTDALVMATSSLTGTPGRSSGSG